MDAPVAVLCTAGYPACEPASFDQAIVTNDVTGMGYLPESRTDEPDGGAAGPCMRLSNFDWARKPNPQNPMISKRG